MICTMNSHFTAQRFTNFVIDEALPTLFFMLSKFFITVGTMLALLSVNSCFVLYKQMVQSKCFHAFVKFCLNPVSNNTVNLPN